MLNGCEDILDLRRKPHTTIAKSALGRTDPFGAKWTYQRCPQAGQMPFSSAAEPLGFCLFFVS